MGTLRGSNRETCRNECSTGLGTLWGTLFGAGRAKEVAFVLNPPPPLAGGVDSEEVEWRPPLLYANPLATASLPP